MECNMRNGRKGDIRTCLFVGAWLPSYMTEPHLEIGAAFPDFFTHLLITALGQ